MKNLLLATAIAAAGLLPMAAMAAGTSPAGTATGQRQIEGSGTSATARAGSGQAGMSGQDGSGGTGTWSPAWVNARSIGAQEMQGLAGRSVSTAEGQEIGQIDAVMRGQEGRTYVLMDVGAALGLGDSQVAVPVTHLRMSGDAIVMSPESEQGLRRQPGYGMDRQTPYQPGGGGAGGAGSGQGATR